MKKRTLSFVLALVMVLSLVLSISPVRVLTLAVPTDTATIIVRDENGSAVDHASVVVKRNGDSLAVESIGEDVKSVKVGDKVLFHIWDELPTYDPDVVVVRENSLLGVFEDE